MKKLSRQILSAFCALVVLFGMCNIVAYAEDGYFVLLDIMGYDETGTEITDANNVFYVRNDTLYAPISVFEDYTMYNYDEENTAFVRVGQEYERANSKVVFNYESATIDIYYLTYQKETLDLDFYQFGDLYFFPLGEMAAYLKSSVVYKSNDTISIVSSGISISDALYNYNPINSCLDYSDLRDDIFAGDEGLYKSACVLGYVGETIFSFKVTNLMGSYGEKEKYVDILESAVTNNEPYEQLLNNDSLLADFLGITEELYNDVYKKATKTYKLSANALTTMFEDYKSMHSFGDASPFENFFPEEQAEIDKINSFSQYIDTVGVFVDAVDFYYKFYTMNQDHKDAIELFSDSSDYDMRAIALSEIADLYGNEVVESAMTQLGEEIEKELLDEALDIAAKEFMSGANKVKLATGIVDAVFNAAGFDLSDNSGYDVMLASQLKHFVLNSVDDSAENLLTQDDCNKMRLTQILGMLIDIQSYKMGNKFAAKYSSEGIYDDELDEANKRIALFYLAKDSEKYDCVEGTQQIADQNKKQIAKLDLSLHIADENTAKKFLATMGNYLEAATELIYNFPKYGMEFVDTSISVELIDLDGNEVPEIVYWSRLGATGVPSIGGFFSYNGNQYTKCEIKTDIEDPYILYPILPKNNNTQAVIFVSGIKSNQTLEAFSGVPEYNSFWNSNASGVAQFNFADNILTITLLEDYTALCDRCTDYFVSEVERMQAWETYKSEIREFNSQYILNEEYNYTIAHIETGYIDPSETTMEKQLEFYHETVNEEFAEYIVEQYTEGVDEVSYSDSLAMNN